VPTPLELPFDPIARAAETWAERFGRSDAMAAVTSIMRAQQILLAELDAVLRPHGLTFARYEALVLLTFSRLVVRRPNPRDGRGKLAEITGSGREVVSRATADLMAAEFGLAGFDPVQREQLFGLLRGLRVAAGDFAATPVSS
jgi:hypothetical protein